MKKVGATVFVISLFVSTHSVGDEQYDIKCTLDSGDVMTLSHSNNTAYIEFLGPNDDPDEGGSVIRLDIPSGGAEQFLDNNSDAKQSFVLRGTDDDIDGAISVGYIKNKGTAEAYFSSMNSLGKEVARYNCTPETIKTSQNLLTTGIGASNPPSKNHTTNNPPAELPFKIFVDEELFEYRSIKTPYRTVNIISTSDDLVIKGVMVNRNQCSESSGNPKTVFKLPFGKTVTYKYSMQYKRCDVVEIVVKTNYNDWTFKP